MKGVTGLSFKILGPLYILETVAQMDLDITKRALSLKPKPVVDFQLYSRHLEKSI